MMKRVLFMLCGVALSAFAASALTPFVEQGKVWSYNLDAYGLEYQDVSGNYLFELKIDGTEDISGQEYAKCFAYLNGELYPDADTPYLFIREDERTSIVYAIYNENFPSSSFPWNLLYQDTFCELDPLGDYEGEIPVFSAFDPLASDTYMQVKYSVENFTGFNMERSVIESSAGTKLYGWRCTIPGKEFTRKLYEGVGYVGGTGTIFSHIGDVLPSNGSAALPTLFQVTRADGEILYLDEDKKPSVAVREVMDTNNPEPAEYYDMSGNRVSKETQGIIIIKQGGESRKEVNKGN